MRFLGINIGKARPAPVTVTVTSEEAVEKSTGNEIMAVIGTVIALTLQNDERHIEEPGFITIINTSKLNRR